MLRRARYQNFKCLKDVTFQPSPFTLVVGRNASGKSSLLQGIALMGDLLQRQPDEHALAGGRGTAVFQGRSDPRRLVTRGPGDPRTHQQVELALEIELHEQTLRASAKTAPGQGHPEIVLRADGARIRGELFTKQMKMSGTEPSSPHEYYTRLEALDRIESLALSPSALARPAYLEGPEPWIDANGYGLPVLLKHIAVNEADAFRAIKEDLRAVVPHVRDIQLPRAEVLQDGSTLWGDALALVFEGTGEVPGDLVSEGTLLTLGILTVVHAGARPDVVLLDDIDRGLHPMAQKELVSCLKRLQQAHSENGAPRLQFICTTHSPYLLDHVEPECVHVLKIDSEGFTRCSKLSAHPEYEKWRGTLATGEFWSYVGEDWVYGAAADR